MRVKMGSKGGGASSHEGRVNPIAPKPARQPDSNAGGNGRNAVDFKINSDQFVGEIPPKMHRTEIDNSGTAAVTVRAPKTIENGSHETRPKSG